MTMSSMNASKLYAWSVVAATAAIVAALLVHPDFGEEELAAVAFWSISSPRTGRECRWATTPRS